MIAAPTLVVAAKDDLFKTLPAAEFIGRFLKHVLPARFQRIRHYGLLANRGKQQRLANGNTLVTLTWQGQALELGPDGRLAWQLTNSVSDGMRGVLTQVDLLPPEMDASFFERLGNACQAN